MIKILQLKKGYTVKLDQICSSIPHTGFLDEEIDIQEDKVQDAARMVFSGSNDFGHIVHKETYGEFFPRTEQEIAAIVQYATAQQIPLSCRGRGHSTFGQSQCENGIIIDLSFFNKVKFTEDGGKITAQSGAKWKSVLELALSKGLTPSALADYLGLSVGGVLSAGGISGHGKWVVDSVVSLRVMTADGVIHECSNKDNSQLFDSTLASFGQFSIILEATIATRKAPVNAVCYSLSFDTLELYIAAQSALFRDKCCNYLEGQVEFQENTGWIYKIDAVIYDDTRLPKVFGSLPPHQMKRDEVSYRDFCNRMKPGVKFLKANQSWYEPHPWINLLLPESAVQAYVGDVLSSLTLKDTGGWPVMLYPIDVSSFAWPYFKSSGSEKVWLFAILRHAKDDQTALQLVEKNRVMYEKAVECGGKMYPIGSIPLTKEDWKKHFVDWKKFKEMKMKYDPFHLLGRGMGIFS